MSDAHIQPSPRTILVVEDDKSTREFYELFLTENGYRVIAVASGHAALTAVTAQPVNALVLDHRLPDMSGTEVCRQLRAGAAPTVPVLLVTGDRAPRLDADARAAGATSVLMKPFDPYEFLDRLDALIPPR